MTKHIQPDDFEGKPAPLPLTKKWWKATQPLTLEERGFALAVLALMHKKRRADLALVLADIGTLAEDLNSRTDTVERLAKCFEHIPDDAVRGQRRRIATGWPEWLVREIVP